MCGWRSQNDQMVLTYQQTIQGAFRDVSNALVAYRKDQEYTIEQEQLYGECGHAAASALVQLRLLHCP